MARRYSQRPKSSTSSAYNAPPIPSRGQAGGASVASATTGRKIVIFREGRAKAGLSQIASAAGLSDIASSADTGSHMLERSQVASSEVFHWHLLDAAVLNTASADQMSRVASLASSDSSDVLVVFDESYFVLTSSAPTPGTGPGTGTGSGTGMGTGAPNYSADYLNGMIDALTFLRSGRGSAVPELLKRVQTPTTRAADVDDQFEDTDDATWGINALGVLDSPYTGSGVKVAILDSGFDTSHPDFTGRNVIVKSFTGLNGQDFNGHGTHCVGIACGGQGGHGKRYGVANGADIYVGQVFGNSGGAPTATDTDIVNGIQWALDQGCHIVSMSLERDVTNNPVRAGESFQDTKAGRGYEEIASRALKQGTLLIAAAGNGSSRPVNILPVNQPANCPSIVAVGALKANMQVAGFSNQAINLDGGRVDFAAPGEGIISSWPMPIRYKVESGTSMATPFVAGIAALLSEKNGLIGGLDLWWELSKAARALGLDAADVGFGMPIAPK